MLSLTKGRNSETLKIKNQSQKPINKVDLKPVKQKVEELKSKKQKEKTST